MKEFKCVNCNIIVGEMSKGKIKKDAKFLCNFCYDKLTKLKVSDDFGSLNSNRPMDILKDLFK